MVGKTMASCDNATRVSRCLWKFYNLLRDILTAQLASNEQLHHDFVCSEPSTWNSSRRYNRPHHDTVCYCQN